MADVLKTEEIKNWDASKIDAKVVDLRKQIFGLRMQQSAAGMEKPHQLKILKKNIARLLTIKTATQAK
ncbi:MAG: 50S ribosomal protein L29 [Bdellovibrionales bacterium CG12_big_fil_rev_8_21_14_0_65_38_15]|nr:MAG: 50S ribosomal protein L29 [Bdellovibrionales bacterium CG22_combo_CG10-13_8_21_14_all_38_13]PIQ55431.1 MAG: 50S ribosomal protein L29 [Bdellovibrionales bacterium CG12_big_fil_rev_8_21_14_0_65_38_15]